jgi:hypothetical protein
MSTLLTSQSIGVKRRGLREAWVVEAETMSEEAGPDQEAADRAASRDKLLRELKVLVHILVLLRRLRQMANAADTTT